MLVDGTFQYPMIKKVNFIKLKRNSCRKLLHIINPKVKIIERALINSLEIIFEGAYTWSTILETEFTNAKANLKTIVFKNEYTAIRHSKTARFTYQKKVQIAKRVFKSSSFGHRTGKSAHQALHYVKTKWNQNTVYFLNYSIIHVFGSINKNRLKNTFNRFVKDPRFWEELEKMFSAGYFRELRPGKGVWCKLLYPFLLNVYMHDFDHFVGNLSDECCHIVVLCNKNKHKDLKVEKYRSPFSGKFSIQMLKIYDELIKHNKKYEQCASNCVVNKGRPFEDVWEFCCVK